MSKQAPETIEDTVRSIVATELRADTSTIQGTTHLMKDLGADSLDALNIAIRLEEAFKIKIPDEAIPTFVTIDDIVRGVGQAVAH